MCRYPPHKLNSQVVALNLNKKPVACSDDSQPTNASKS